MYDGASGLMRVQGPEFSASGFVGSAKARLFADTWISFAAADGKALEMADVEDKVGLDQTLQQIHAQRAQAYAVSVNGKVNRTGTRWRTSYRWQPSESLTEVARLRQHHSGWLPDNLSSPTHPLWKAISEWDGSADRRSQFACRGISPICYERRQHALFCADRTICAGWSLLHFLNLSYS